MTIELERTYLAKKIPDLKNCESIEILDIYLPDEDEHPKLRVRKNGYKYEMTKKTPLDDTFSKFEEQTIELTRDEFHSLARLHGKRVHKIRYLYPYKGLTAEIDIFCDYLKGLAVVEFEFPDEKTKDNFKMPDFCLVEVTKDDFIAGGMLCGKKYFDIKPKLEKYNYTRLGV